MKNILLLSTGGTIASMPGVSGLSPRLAADGILNYVPELNEICKITCKTIFNLDSSNIQPKSGKSSLRKLMRRN